MFGWDWGPILPDAGIWRDIELEANRFGTIEDAAIRQYHEAGRVTLYADVQLDRLSAAGSLVVEAELTAPDGSVLTARVEPAELTAMLSWSIDAPQLWWPNGYGNQPLYELQISLREAGSGIVLDRKRLAVGLRTIELRRRPDEWGESFEFVVNGVPVFIKRANYIPEDSFPARNTPERTERLVRDSAAAHMNLLRVWGGGVYARRLLLRPVRSVRPDCLAGFHVCLRRLRA